MATFTDIYKQELKNRGVISSIGSAAFKRTLESIDPRNILFGGKGFVSATGQKIFGKGYSGISRASPTSKISEGSALSNQALTQLLISSKNQEAQLSIVAKNTMNMNAMARDMNVMRQNIMKLVTMQGGRASRGADMFFRDAAARESAYESQFTRAKGTAPTPVKQEDKKGGFFGSILGLGGAIVSAITSVLKGIPDVIGKVLTGIFSVSNLSKILGFTASAFGELGSFILKVSPFLLKLAPLIGAVAGATWLLRWLDDKNRQANTPETRQENVGNYRGSESQKFATENLNQKDAEEYLRSLDEERVIGETGLTKRELAAELELAKREKRPLKIHELRVREEKLRAYRTAQEEARDMEGSSQGMIGRDSLQDARALERASYAPTPVSGTSISRGTSPVPTNMRNLLDLIGSKEGGKDGYNATLGFGRYDPEWFKKMKENGKNLTDLTLEEVFKLQKDILKNKDNKFDSSAVGKYQIVSNTLFGKGGTPQYPTPNSLMRQLNLKPTDKFDEETQDKMAIQLMKGRGLNKFLSGRMTEEQFISNLSKEWESLPENMANVSGLTKGKRSLVGYEQIASAVSGLKLNNASATTQQMRAELASTQAPVVVPVPTTSPQQGQRPTQTTPIASAFNENAAELFLDNAIDIAG